MRTGRSLCESASLRFFVAENTSPWTASGHASDNVMVRFVRRSGETQKSIIAGRASLRPIDDGWKVRSFRSGRHGARLRCCCLPGRSSRYRNALTDELLRTDRDGSLRLSTALANFPVALFVNDD